MTHPPPFTNGLYSDRQHQAMTQHINYFTSPGLMPGYRVPGKRYLPRLIVYRISEYYDVPLTLLQARTRQRPVVECRQVCCYFLRRLTDLSLKEIGAMMGGRDHTTAIHAIKTVGDLMASDPVYKNRLEHLTKIM